LFAQAKWRNKRSVTTSIRRDYFRGIQKDTLPRAVRVSFINPYYLAAPASFAPGTSNNFPVSTS
jgi:hypothetical protein